MTARKLFGYKFFALKHEEIIKFDLGQISSEPHRHIEMKRMKMNCYMLKIKKHIKKMSTKKDLEESEKKSDADIEMEFQWLFRLPKKSIDPYKVGGSNYHLCTETLSRYNILHLSKSTYHEDNPIQHVLCPRQICK